MRRIDWLFPPWYTAGMRFLAFLLVLFSSSSPWAHAGHDQGNGGDLYSAEFIDAGERVVYFLRNNGTKDLDLDKLERVVKATKVESTEQPLLLKGMPKDAINYPSQGRIVFNRQRWSALTPGQRPVLVLHEYLGIMGVEDASYSFSRKIIGAFEYSADYVLVCTFNGGKSDLNIGVDESASMDTVLMSINWNSDGVDSDFGDIMLPLGQWSRMIRDGNFTLSFNDEFLVTAQPNGKPLEMKGFLAAKGKTYPLDCKIKKWSKADLEKWDKEHAND